MPHDDRVGAVLVLGPPGVGKSLLGGALARAHASGIHSFLNVGEELRTRGLVEPLHTYPNEAGRAEVGAEAAGGGALQVAA
jgi:hypothetical protein